MRILIVDDNYASRKLLSAHLEVYGECVTANDGREGLNKYIEGAEAGQPFQLVCLDIMMPEMDGREALKEIRAWESANGMAEATQAKIIMTTALDDRLDIIESFNEGCEAYIIKPIEANQLIKTLKQLRVIED